MRMRSKGFEGRGLENFLATHSSVCLALYRLEWKLYIVLVVRINKFPSGAQVA